MNQLTVRRQTDALLGVDVSDHSVDRCVPRIRWRGDRGRWNCENSVLHLSDLLSCDSDHGTRSPRYASLRRKPFGQIQSGISGLSAVRVDHAYTHPLAALHESTDS